MIKEFVPYKESIELKELGFDEPCITSYNESGKLFKIWEDEQVIGITKCLAPTFSQAFRWFREKYDLHVQIRKENYFYKSKYEYFHYDISRGEENDITNQEELHSNIMDECRQNIPGNYLNDDKLAKLIFEKKFAFYTYEEIELECLKKLIEIVKSHKLPDLTWKDASEEELKSKELKSMKGKRL